MKWEENMLTYPPEVLTRASRTKLLLLDVDGVLTDAKIILDSEGREVKHFCVRDGLGIKLLQQIGIEVGILSSRLSAPVEHRARELGIQLIIQGELNKFELYERIKHAKGLEDEDIAYMGDDWIDLPVLKSVGLAVTVPDAWPPVKNFVHYVTRCKGGQGAVREVCDLILQAQRKWEELLKCFEPAYFCFS